jgi:DNA-nicking Smr family endonuclease
MASDREGRPVKPPSKQPSAKKAAGRLSDEERELWEHTARTLQPIRGKKGRVHPAAQEVEPPPRTAKPDAPKPAAPRKPAAPPPVAKIALPPPAPIALERRKARKLSSGRIEIEGRIDLHGMRQAEAHTALIRFLKRGHADGKRWVLVITGKGAPARTAHDERLRYESDERGVLRRNVPRWLAEPDLAAIVIGFTTAAINHGGEGALYVQIRRNDRSA